MKTLEEILREYFSDKLIMFNKNGSLTEAGEEAYKKLTRLLLDVGILTGQDTSRIIRELDEICDSKH